MPISRGFLLCVRRQWEFGKVVDSQSEKVDNGKGEDG